MRDYRNNIAICILLLSISQANSIDGNLSDIPTEIVAIDADTPTALATDDMSQATSSDASELADTEAATADDATAHQADEASQSSISSTNEGDGTANSQEIVPSTSHQEPVDLPAGVNEQPDQREAQIQDQAQAQAQVQNDPQATDTLQQQPTTEQQPAVAQEPEVQPDAQDHQMADIAQQPEPAMEQQTEQQAAVVQEPEVQPDAQDQQTADMAQLPEPAGEQQGAVAQQGLAGDEQQPTPSVHRSTYVARLAQEREAAVNRLAAAVHNPTNEQVPEDHPHGVSDAEEEQALRIEIADAKDKLAKIQARKMAKAEKETDAEAATPAQDIRDLPSRTQNRSVMPKQVSASIDEHGNEVQDDENMVS
jgi:hypothetical protein